MFAAETLEDIPVTYDDGGAYSILFIPTPHYPRPRSSFRSGGFGRRVF